MNESAFYFALLVAYVACALITFPILFLVTAPYGRHAGASWQGPTINNRLGWLLMESPAALVFGWCFLVGAFNDALVMRVFFVMWESHYVCRAFIYPFTLRGKNKQMPLVVAALAFLFNITNGYLNGRYLFTFSGGYPDRWLLDPRFLVGAVLFVAGYLICRQSDYLLRRLRRPGESGYSIPNGGLFRWVSAPNYLGEIVEWGGWALATWSLPGLAFFIWVVANLVPRARAHHRWYQSRFADYPPRRRALLPGVW